MKKKDMDCRPKQKRRQVSLREEECDSSDENNDTDSSVSSTSRKKRKRKVIKLKDEQLDLQCEWQGCDYFTCNLDDFVRHVSFHIPQLEVKMNEDQEGTGTSVIVRVVASSNNASFPIIRLLISP
jgi:DNA polymerase II small subunit/DNA polymerase delta subunit B